MTAKHGELSGQVMEAHRAVGEYRAALEALSRAGANLGAQLAGLARAVDDEGAREELTVLAAREARTREVVNAAAVFAFRELAEEPFQTLATVDRSAEKLVSERRVARLDVDSFSTRKLPERAEEARAKLESLTLACEAEFLNFRDRAGVAAIKASAAFSGCQAFFFDRASDAAQTRLLYQDDRSLTTQSLSEATYATYAAAALVLCALYEQHLDQAYNPATPERRSLSPPPASCIATTDDDPPQHSAFFFFGVFVLSSLGHFFFWQMPPRRLSRRRLVSRRLLSR